MRSRRSVLVLPALLLALGAAGCGDGEPAAGRTTAPAAPSTTTSTPSATTTTKSATKTATPTKTATKSATSKPAPTTTTRTPVPTKTAPPKPSVPSLKGDTRNSWAFAPLDDPGNLTIEGEVSSYKAWSTSKVLVVAAYLDTAAKGDPANVPSATKNLITRALTASDGDAVVAVRGQIPGSPGAAINAVLRDIGDTTTSAPDASQGGMQWTIREQIRFMTALSAGRVVSPAASRYLLDTMHPIAEHSWGLGTIGASSFKGGWLTSGTVTRQMGIVDGYAVAIITNAVGPAVLQTDGDSAHVQQMNALAKQLKVRLDSIG